MDLSNNAIEALPPGGLAAFPSLKVLRMRGNRLRSAVGFGLASHLLELDLSDNQVRARGGEGEGALPVVRCAMC